MTDRFDPGAVWRLQALEYFPYIIWQKPDVFPQTEWTFSRRMIVAGHRKPVVRIIVTVPNEHS
jgi:hypothetical protein